MIIAQISDTHIAVDLPDSAARAYDLEQCVDDINALDPLPDAVIHTGDVTNGGRREEYAKAASILAALRCPFHVAAGNRDERLALRAAFPDEDYLLSDTPFVQYVVDCYAVQLIALDTQSMASNKGDFCQDRADSLDRALDRALAHDSSRPVALFMHHPPFEITASDFPFQYESREPVSRLERVLNRRANVVRVFCGHAHRGAEGRVGPVPATTMPSVAKDLRMGDYEADIQHSPLYQIHRYDPESGFVTETRAAGRKFEGAGYIS